MTNKVCFARYRKLAAIAAAMLTLGCAGTRPALPLADPAASGFSPPDLARITPFLQAYVDSGKVGGIYAVIARDGHIVYEETVGWSDVERQKKLKRDAVFRIFSMTKPVVAVGALKLVDQGKISLDDPVAKYIPSFAHVKVFAGGSADAPLVRDADSVMTIRHLLTHTSGLGYGLTRTAVDSIFLRATLYDPATTLAQFTDSLARLPLHFTPGTRWSYSAGIDVVGRVIEVASGKTLDRFLTDEIFAPLGMERTSFRWTPALRRKATALYMRGTNGELSEVTGGLTRMYEDTARFMWGSGGLLSTPDDFLRFAQMLLNGGEFDGVRVLSQNSVTELTRNQLAPELMPQPGRSMLDPGYGFGLAGSVLVDQSKSEMPGATGIYRWSGYVGTYFWIDPHNRMLAMVWTQFSPGSAYRLEDDFQRLVYGALQR
jgi:CubicO group peptidase (beta-lactamase class C family)